MCCPVVLRGGEKAGIVRAALSLHECWDKLVRRQAAQRPVFRRHDNVETACGRRDEPLLGQTVQGSVRGRSGHTQRAPRFSRAKVVAPGRSQVFDVFTALEVVARRFHAHRITFFVILCDQNLQRGVRVPPPALVGLQRLRAFFFPAPRPM
jgi:hypothetical protein